MNVPKAILDHDGYEQIGRHVPKLDPSTIDYFQSDTVWRASRTTHDDGIQYWDGHRLWQAWDGAPCHFNLMD